MLEKQEIYSKLIASGKLSLPYAISLYSEDANKASEETLKLLNYILTNGLDADYVKLVKIKEAVDYVVKALLSNKLKSYPDTIEALFPIISAADQKALLLKMYKNKERNAINIVIGGHIALPLVIEETINAALKTQDINVLSMIVLKYGQELKDGTLYKITQSLKTYPYIDVISLIKTLESTENNAIKRDDTIERSLISSTIESTRYEPEKLYKLIDAGSFWRGNAGYIANEIPQTSKTSGVINLLRTIEAKNPRQLIQIGIASINNASKTNIILNALQDLSMDKDVDRAGFNHISAYYSVIYAHYKCQLATMCKIISSLSPKVITNYILFIIDNDVNYDEKMILDLFEALVLSGALEEDILNLQKYIRDSSNNKGRLTGLCTKIQTKYVNNLSLSDRIYNDLVKGRTDDKNIIYVAKLLSNGLVTSILNNYYQHLAIFGGNKFKRCEVIDSYIDLLVRYRLTLECQIYLQFFEDLKSGKYNQESVAEVARKLDNEYFSEKANQIGMEAKIISLEPQN